MVYDTLLNRQTITSSHAFSTKTYMYEYYKLLKKKISLERYFKAYTEGFILERVKSNRFLNLLFFRDNLVSRYKHIQVSVKSTESLDLNFQ